MFNNIKSVIMKTSKVGATIKSKKTSEAGEATKSKRVTAGKSEPSEEEIRKKAFEIYHQRIDRGEHGNASDDWNKAVELLRNS
jgi:hypothetical protein